MSLNLYYLLYLIQAFEFLEFDDWKAWMCKGAPIVSDGQSHSPSGTAVPQPRVLALWWTDGLQVDGGPVYLYSNHLWIGPSLSLRSSGRVDGIHLGEIGGWGINPCIVDDWPSKRLWRSVIVSSGLDYPSWLR